MKRKYEIGVVINPEATEEEVRKIIDSIANIIKKAKGSIENIDEWGRRKLAFPIEKHKEGIYVFINTDVVGTAFFTIERRLKLSEKVMRFVILRLDDKLKKANKLTKKWKRMEKISRKPHEIKEENLDDENPEDMEVENED
jgi:small subunit ribosomal protein S6